MKIKLSKSQWEMIGQKTGWKTSQTTKYFLETYIDGKQMLGSDGTWVLHSPNNINKEVNDKIKQLISLSTEVHPYITKAQNITLKLTDQSGLVLKIFDITKDVLKTNEVKDKIFEASIYGTKAFNEGKKRIPSLDKNLMDLINSLDNKEVGSSKPLLNAWLESWDAANLSKE